jgi:anti-sigma regulatory factor (Ser/Thr protein kinase)
MSSEQDSAAINCFMLNELDTHPSSVIVRIATRFGISRQAALKRMRTLIRQGDVKAIGSTKARRYELIANPVVDLELKVKELEEDIVYFQKVRPAIGNVPDNIQRICNYGFTEMLNNVIDHSESDIVRIKVSRTPSIVELFVLDSGIGIFEKIKNTLGLQYDQQALAALSAGKFTTDSEHHSGQGIFFTSRVFDHFSIVSGSLHFWHRTNHDDWLTEHQKHYVKGTFVRMRICVSSTTTTKEVFDKFSTANDEYGFSRTHVPISLSQVEKGSLVSRSQAKRVLERFNQFEEVLLDFKHVESIGQAFADEIFRVFRRNNPSVRMTWTHANPEVEAMIQRALRASTAPQSADKTES